MKKFADKPIFVELTSSKKSGAASGAASDVSGTAIKLKAVTPEERQRLRIPSYQYLLP